VNIRKLFLFLLVAITPLFVYADENDSAHSYKKIVTGEGDSKYIQSYVRTIEDFRKGVIVDTVAKVLNYTDGLADDNNTGSFWYAYDAKNCIYRKAAYKYLKTLPEDKSPLFDVDENTRELNLNYFDKSSVQYNTMQLTYPSVLGSAPRVTNQITVFADGREIFKTEGLDPKRISKGWALIYSKYCSGAKKEF